VEEKLATYAATLKKGAHVQVEGPVHSREYEKEGVVYRVSECKAEAILKLDRTDRAEQPVAEEMHSVAEDAPAEGVPS
jgi:single-strand DNA-binding protein